MNLLDTASLVVTPNGYKASKLYSIIPSDGTGDMTFARTGDTATRVNSSGLIESVLANKPRLDYFNSTCPKLLLEPARTNTATYSSDLSQNAISDITIGTNTLASPDGTTNADSVIENGTTGAHALYNYGFSFTNGSAYTFSIFCKKGTRDWLAINLNDSTNTIAYFNINTGTVGNITGSMTASIVNYGNGWYRCSVTKTVAATSGGFVIYAASANGTNTYAGVNGNTAFYGFGLQMELGAYATSYIPTTTASVTRNVDFCYKTSASALIGQTQGTIFAEVNFDNISAESILILGDLTSGNFMYIIRSTAGNITFEIYSSGAGQASISKTGNNYGVQKMAVSYKTNEIKFFINGVQVGSTDTSATIPAVSIVRFNESASAGNNLKLKSFALWSTSLTSQELITLTTI